MPYPFQAMVVAFLTLCVAALVPSSRTAAAPLAGRSCPVLYRGSQHVCYAAPNALTVRSAEQQMPVPVVRPVATVGRFTSLPLTSVIVDQTRRDTGVLHPWVISYVFGQAPDLGLPAATVSPSARFLVIGEAVGRITLQVNGVGVFDTPQFQRIRVNGRGTPLWHVSVNLPHRNATLVIHSTLPRPTLERLITALL